MFLTNFSVQTVCLITYPLLYHFFCISRNFFSKEISNIQKIYLCIHTTIAKYFHHLRMIFSLFYAIIYMILTLSVKM